jgi:hypothetical protein
MTYGLSVVPDPYNDRLNAEDYTKKYQADHSIIYVLYCGAG